MSTGKGSKSIVGADAAQTGRCVRSAAIKCLLVVHRAECARVDHIETHSQLTFLFCPYFNLLSVFGYKDKNTEGEGGVGGGRLNKMSHPWKEKKKKQEEDLGTSACE